MCAHQQHSTGQHSTVRQNQHAAWFKNIGNVHSPSRNSQECCLLRPAPMVHPNEPSPTESGSPWPPSPVVLRPYRAWNHRTHGSWFCCAKSARFYALRFADCSSPCQSFALFEIDSMTNESQTFRFDLKCLVRLAVEKNRHTDASRRTTSVVCLHVIQSQVGGAQRWLLPTIFLVSLSHQEQG